MSVLIRGMEMPKSCMDCPCFCEENFYCRVKESDDIGLGKRPSDCPLVLVPQHGRLIDADALCEGRVSNDNVVICAKAAPTIIPAEEAP